MLARENIVFASDLTHPVVSAILLNKGKYVMQLRDDKPGINAPGMWGLFGGYRKEYEYPASAIRRELKEELGLSLGRLSYCSDYESHVFFTADISDQYGNIVLGEGMDYGSFSLDELRKMNTSTFALEILEKFESKGLHFQE